MKAPPPPGTLPPNQGGFWSPQYICTLIVTSRPVNLQNAAARRPAAAPYHGTCCGQACTPAGGRDGIAADS